MSALEQLRDDPSSRKRFLKMVGGTGAASALALVMAACGKDEDETAPASTTKSSMGDGNASGDIDIVNYALTLEYLEADFYKQVAESGVIKDAATLSLAKQFGATEQAHVEALTTAVKGLGGTPATKPSTKFGELIEMGPDAVLKAAADVENLGAAAYLGQAGRIKDKKILAAALSIHSVEARHAAALNQLIGRGFKGSLPDGAFAKPMDMQAVLAAVKPYIAA